MPESLHMSQPRYTRVCQGPQMLEVEMTRQFLTLEAIRWKVKDAARRAINRVVSNKDFA